MNCFELEVEGYREDSGVCEKGVYFWSSAAAGLEREYECVELIVVGLGWLSYCWKSVEICGIDGTFGVPLYAVEGAERAAIELRLEGVEGKPELDGDCWFEAGPMLGNNEVCLLASTPLPRYEMCGAGVTQGASEWYAALGRRLWADTRLRQGSRFLPSALWLVALACLLARHTRKCSSDNHHRNWRG